MTPSTENEALLTILTSIKDSWENELAQERDSLDKTRIFKLSEEDMDNVQSSSPADEPEPLDKTIMLNVENAPCSVKSEEFPEFTVGQSQGRHKHSQDESPDKKEMFDDESLNETVMIKPEELDKLSRRQNR